MAIEITSQFNNKAGKPLDVNSVKATIVERDAITDRYIGLRVFVEETLTEYVLKYGITNNDWIGEASITKKEWVSVKEDINNIKGITYGHLYNQVIFDGQLVASIRTDGLYANAEVGTGYTSNSILTLDGGDNNFTIRYLVIGAGTPTEQKRVMVVTIGTNYSAGVYSVIGGTGTGMKVRLYVDVDDNNNNVYFVRFNEPRIYNIMHTVKDKNTGTHIELKFPTYDDIQELLTFTDGINNPLCLIANRVYNETYLGTDEFGFNGRPSGGLQADNFTHFGFSDFLFIPIETTYKYDGTWDSVTAYGINVVSNTGEWILNSKSYYYFPIRLMLSNIDDYYEGLEVLDDNQKYTTIKIGNQAWLVEPIVNINDLQERNNTLASYSNNNDNNIDYSVLKSYVHPDKHPASMIEEDINRQFISKNEKENLIKNTYNENIGYRYNIPTILNPKNLAPNGWHIPTLTEWQTLITFIGNDARKLKSTRVDNLFGWNTDANSNIINTNDYGFNILHYNPSGNYPSYEIYATSTIVDTIDTYSIRFTTNTNDITQSPSNYNFSYIRLIKDNSEWIEGDVVKIDGIIYNTVKIGEQVWITTNLRTKIFRDYTPLIYSIIPSNNASYNSPNNPYIYGELPGTLNKIGIENVLTGNDILTHSHNTLHPIKPSTFIIEPYNIVWEGDWIKVESGGGHWHNAYYDYVMVTMDTGSGTVTLPAKIRVPNWNAPEVLGQQGSPEFGGFYLKVLNNYLTPESNIHRIIVNFHEVTQNRPLYSAVNGNGASRVGYSDWNSDGDVRKWNAPNVIVDDTASDGVAHGLWMKNTFLWYYNTKLSGSFTGQVLLTEDDTTLSEPNFEGGGKLDVQQYPKYCRDNEADLIMEAFLHSLHWLNEGANPDILTFVCHFSNSPDEWNYQRNDTTTTGIPDIDRKFPLSTIGCGAGDLNASNASWQTSYGEGVEFIEPTTASFLTGITPSNPWSTTSHQQSPATAIIGAKFKYIKNQTGVSWNTVRLACRATATQSTYNIANNIKWDKWRGFGVIDCAAAITWINNLKTSFKTHLKDRYEEGNGYCSFMDSVDDYTDNTPLPKKLTVSKPKGNYVNNAAALTAGLQIGDIYHTDGVIKMVVEDDEYNKYYVFYPTALTDKTVYNNTDVLFNNSSYKIQSIDYINKIITIDKDIELPLFSENYPNTWQVHVKPSNPNESTNIIQLSEVLSSNSFKYSGTITESKFTVNKSISFRNPYMYYVPTNGFNIISCDNTNINGFYPLFLTKHNGRYHAIIMTLTGGAWTTTHHITSTNFVTWEQCDSSNTINSIFTLGTGWWSNTQPTGLNGNLFFGNSNVSNSTDFILPISLFVGNPYTHQRIGIAYIKKDFSSLTISTNPITFVGFDNNDNTFTLGETSMMKCNGKTYLTVERVKLPNETSVGRTVWLYEYDIINNTTKLIDSISPSRIGNEKWNDNLIQQPALFTVKGKLYLNCRGYSGTSTSSITPNAPNSGGLYYYDEVKNSLVEYFNNPMVINPKLNSGVSELFDHTGYNVYVEDGDNVYALISLTHGMNLYNILPSVLNIQSPITVSEWVKNNR